MKKAGAQTKRILSVLLAVIMMANAVMFGAFAKADKADAIICEIENPLYYEHMQFVKEQNYFKEFLKGLTAFATYDDDWFYDFADDIDVHYAQALLLTLIERIETSYENRVFEAFLSDLSDAQNGYYVAEKVDAYAYITGLNENSGFCDALSSFIAALHNDRLTNDSYITCVKAFAKILSIQTACIDYTELFDDIISDLSGAPYQDCIITAAQNIKTQFISEMESVRDAVITRFYDALAANVYSGLSNAAEENTALYAANKIMHQSGYDDKKMFSTQNLYEYMLSLGNLVAVEDVVASFSAKRASELYAYNAVSAEETGVSAAEKKLSSIRWDFAINMLLTFRETGETQLKKLPELEKIVYWSKILSPLAETTGKEHFLWSNEEELQALVRSGAIACAKLHAYRQILSAPTNYATYSVYTFYGAGREALIYDDDRQIGFIPHDTQVEHISERAAWFQSYDEDLGGYIKVVVSFASGIHVIYRCTHSSLETKQEIQIPSTFKIPGSYVEVVYCGDCGKEISRTRKELPLADHTPGHVETVDISLTDCEVGGFETVALYCAECNAEISRQTVEIPADQHFVETWENHDIYADTAYREGVCVVCGKTMREPIEPLPNVPNEPETESSEENNVPAPKLNFFQRFIQWFRNLFAKLFGRK